MFNINIKYNASSSIILRLYHPYLRPFPSYHDLLLCTIRLEVFLLRLIRVVPCIQCRFLLRPVEFMVSFVHDCVFILMVGLQF